MQNQSKNKNPQGIISVQESNHAVLHNCRRAHKLAKKENLKGFEVGIIVVKVKRRTPAAVL